MGQSSGQQTSTTKQDPWSGQQPYLQDIFAQANSTYNSGVGGQYFPGSTVVPFSPDTESGMGQVRNTASQPAQGFDQASNVTSQAMTGGQPIEGEPMAGEITAPEIARQPRCPVLAHFADTDASIPMDGVTAFTAAHPEVTVCIYPGHHGFNCDHRAAYDAAAATLARERTLAFFKLHIG